MAARLEDQRDLNLEHARIALMLIDQGKEEPTYDRLDWIMRRVRDAREAQGRLDAKRQRKERYGTG